MILFYDDADGHIEMISTWTLLNPDTYQVDEYLMIEGVGQKPIPDGLSAMPFAPDSGAAMSILIDAIQGDDKNRYTANGSEVLLDGTPVSLDFTPGQSAESRNSLKDNSLIRTFFTMTDEELSTYMQNNGYTEQQAGPWVLLRKIIRDIALAARLMEN